MSNASFARLLDGGEQSVIGVCFRNKQCFERDRPLLYVPAWGGKEGQEMGSRRLDDSE